jgi:membrane protein YdbS with pleckstrin-like domain
MSSTGPDLKSTQAPADLEEVYFEGSPPARAYSAKILLYWTSGTIVLVIAVLLFLHRTGPTWLKLGVTALGWALWVIPLIIAKIHQLSFRYRITNYRIDFERGLLSKNIDTLELWHIEDIHFHQSLLDRALDVGTITVVAHDGAMPKLELRGLPRPRPIYEELKRRVIAVKRQRGVIKMDQG